MGMANGWMGDMKMKNTYVNDGITNEARMTPNEWGNKMDV
jgi:hypothetical protein